MHLYDYPKRRFLLLIPVFFLILNALYFQYASRHIQRALLQEKVVEITDAVDMLAAAVEANPKRTWYEHERNLSRLVEYLDGIYQVFAAAYMPGDDGELRLITSRNFETSVFEPLEFSEFRAAILAQESGLLTVGYTPELQEYRDLHIYFRWMPLYSPPGERFLVAAGVSQLSVVTKIPAWISVGQWVSTAVTFILNAWLVILIARQREGRRYD